jgi:uncharacterized protein YehS (DUF1456 family)
MMSVHDKAGKSVWNLIEGVKDVVNTNMMAAIRSGQLKIEANQVQVLLTLLAASIDEGYHRGYKTMLKSVDAAYLLQQNKKDDSKKNLP